jgi:hypothetical protein
MASVRCPSARLPVCPSARLPVCPRRLSQDEGPKQILYFSWLPSLAHSDLAHSGSLASVTLS